MEKYPYFIYPDIIKLKQDNLSEKERDTLTARVVANMGDAQTVTDILGIDQQEFVRKFSAQKTETSKSGFGTIEAFLDKFPGKIGGPSVEISVPEPKSEKLDIRENKKGNHSPAKVIKKDQKFTELVKNKKYSEAIAFLEAENLNNPEKNIYFATQIRFLKKLQENHNRKINRKQEN